MAMEANGKAALFKKYLSGNCSREELTLLLSYFADHRGDAALRQLITEAIENVPQDSRLQERAAQVAATVRADLIKQIGQQTANKRARRAMVVSYVAIAAAIAIVLTTGILLYTNQNIANDTVASTKASALAADVPAGRNRAMLTLPDGRTVTLSADKEGIRVDDSLRYADGSIVTGMASLPVAGGAATSGQPEWLALVTPRGGQYRIELPDGSQVWLNAASTLRYPTRFSGKNRVVELDGEAYFEVHKQAKPFLVKANSQTVRVLGTRFNVSAYHDDDQTVTTLVDGSVDVQVAGKNDEVRLVPGEQSVVKARSITKAQVDVAQFVNWKDGSFSFRETEIHEVMKQLSRWYDVEVIIDETIPTTFFYGDIKRDKSLAQVLNILKKGGVNFTIIQNAEGTKLRVMP